MRMSEIKEAVSADRISRSGQVYTVRKGFFYRHGRTSKDLVSKVKTAFPEAVVLESGEVWKPFRGGAPLSRQSHWFVKFTIPEYDPEAYAADMKFGGSSLGA